MFIWVSSASADNHGDADEHGKPAEEREDKVEKSGGQFLLLGTECRAEEETLETTPGSPPLDVDDAATPGCNGWEINVVTTGEFGKSKSWETPLLDINYGIGDNLQLKYEVPYEISQADGMTKSGVGAAELGVKYRFYEDESRDMTLAVYPQVEFALPGTAAADDEDGTGTITKLPLLFSTKLGETSKGDIMLTANIGYNVSTRPATEHYISGALGIGFPLTSRIALMVEGSTEQALHRNMENVRERYLKANLGLIGSITPHLLWFGSAGQTFASSDDEDSSHTCVSLGFRVIAGGP